MADATDLHDDALWLGGSYDLAMELGDRDDSRLAAALDAVWRAAQVEDCVGVPGEAGNAVVESECTLDALLRHGRLAGRTVLPRGRPVVCGVRALRGARAAGNGRRAGVDWLVFFLPVGALDRAEPRSAAFPFRGGDSLLWRRPLDRWLSGIGAAVHQEVPYRLGLVGPDVAGLTTARALDGEPPAERWAGYLIPRDGELVYHQADR
ncbi:hypothetical protein [Jiangella asiatica]|uniref:Uncharacterized protein n=1 Tax=Jiangella asiatica TaxID=2530372 RepID=A0A4R5CL17_9ACTN|nr:hypothetical protein [Jiangella asiatica]TDD99083.1 hypothetical protein E1269_27595 [Jiangella asiatica]